MPIYDRYGNLLNTAYGLNGLPLTQAYDVDDELVFNAFEPDPEIPDVEVTAMNWNMTDAYKQRILDILDYIKSYQQSNLGSYSMCQFNDVHENFGGNEPNFIDYNKGYKVLSRILFLGDMANNANPTWYARAVTYMSGASASKRIVGMGNHEYMYTPDNDPESAYKVAINVDATYMNNNFLIYYSDDTVHNVRYIVLDPFYSTLAGTDSSHVLDMEQLSWCASVMSSAGNKDIIIAEHSMMNPFYFLNTGQQASSSATLQNQQYLINLIQAFKSRGSITFTVDGAAHTHSFSQCRGSFIMFISGHYHALGRNDFGFNMFTCPSLARAYGTDQYTGFTFYIVDRARKKIKVIGCPNELADYLTYEFSY